MGITNFDTVDVANGVKVGGSEVINSSGEWLGGIDAPAGSIGTSELADAAVTNAKIANGTIEATKLAPGVGGGGSVTIYNTEVTPLLAGTLVKLDEYDTTNGQTVVKADADQNLIATHIVKDEIAASATGTVYETETVTGIDTSLQAIGDKVYADGSVFGGGAGAFTYTAPFQPSQYVQEVGTVKTVDAAGSIEFYPGLRILLKTDGSQTLQDSSLTSAKFGDAVTLYGGAAAVNYLYITGVGSDAEEVVVDFETYEFDTNASFTGIQVDISGDQSATACAAALVAAINANSGVAKAYDASDGTNGIVAIHVSFAGDTNLSTTTTMVNGVWADATTLFGATVISKNLYGSFYVIDAADVTATTAANGAIPIGCVSSSNTPSVYSITIQDTNGQLYTPAATQFNWVQVDTDQYMLIAKSTAATSDFTSGDIIRWMSIDGV